MRVSLRAFPFFSSPFLLSFFLLLFLFSPPLPGEAAVFKETRSLLGTMVEITVVADQEAAARGGMERAFAEIERIEGLMSFYRPDSEVSRINREAFRRPVRVSSEVFRLLQHAQFLSRLSGGAFDITFSPLWQLWGQCARQKRLPTAAELDRAKGLVDYRQVWLQERGMEVRLGRSGMSVNLGGIAKGYALSRAGEMMRRSGLDNFLINLGGDILAAGPGREGRGWRIGIKHPRKPGELVGVLRLQDRFSLTSGDYERYFEIGKARFHHIIDVRTGYPASRCAAVTLVTPQLPLDYLPSVVLFLLGPERAASLRERFPGVAYLIITPEGRIFASPDLSSYQESPLPARIEMPPSD